MNPSFPKSFQPVQQQQSPQFPSSFKPTEMKQDKVEEPQEDDLDLEIERNIARFTSRALEQIAGAPGNIRDLLYVAKDIYKKQKPVLEKYFPKEPEMFKEFEKTVPVTDTVSKWIGYLPTSSDLKKKSIELTGGYTEPKAEYERIGDEIFENMVSASLPGTGQRTLFRNIGIPIASTLAKEGIAYIGGSEKEQTYGQLGTMFALNLMNRGNAPEFTKKLWDNVNKLTPNAQVNSTPYISLAQNVKNNLSKGLLAPSEKTAISTIDSFLDKAKKGHLTAEELISSNRSLNEIMGDPSLLERGRTQLTKLSKIIKSGVDEVGVNHPEFLSAWKDANEAFGALKQSNHVANFIENNYGKPFISEGMRALLGSATHAGAKTLGAVPPVFLLYKGSQVLNRIARSPVLTRHYVNAARESLIGNVGTMSSNLEKLDKELAKQEKKKPPFKD